MKLVLGDEQARYVGKVLRLKKGDQLTTFDGSGAEFPATITSISKDKLGLLVGASQANDIESPVRIRLVQGISRGERMDIVIQKATELGVSQIVPVLTEFSVVRLDDARSAKKATHWQKVAASACEQCGRNVVPRVDIPQSLKKWLDKTEPESDVLILLDAVDGKSLTDISLPDNRVSVLIGPEGGLSKLENEQAVAAGFESVSLGPRILRTETAAIAAIAALQTLFGDLA